MMYRIKLVMLALVALTIAPARGSDPLTVRLNKLQQEFEFEISPIIESHCVECHDSVQGEAGLDLSIYRGVSQINRSHRVWKTILGRVEAGEMPPPDSSVLVEQDRRRLTRWIREVRSYESEQNSGDPGFVPVHRLNRAQYDYCVRDLTAIDMRPAQTFPVDPANEAGFDNSGESLAMSPVLMNKYLQAARSVASHLVLTPTGIRFAPHPVTTDTDRDKYCVKRIVEFYLRQPTDYADYFFATWKFRYRSELGRPDVTLDDLANDANLSAKYLNLIWEALNDRRIQGGPLHTLQQMWNDLAAVANEEVAFSVCLKMREFVLRARKQFEPHFENLRIPEVHKGTQAFVLWKNKQYALHRRSANFASLEKETARQSAENLDQREPFRADCERFCSIFPDAFYISERGRDYLGKPKDEQEKGRLLSAGFHSMMGYFRDDLPLQELILDEREQRQLDTLWRELDFVTSAPMRQYQGFLWFDRTDSRFMRDPQFDFARPEDKAALSEPVIRRLGEVYLAKARANGGEAIPLSAIEDYFREINQQIRWVEKTRLEAEPLHIEAALEFASRAYRRPLTMEEQDELRQFYRSSRTDGDLSHEEATADMIVAILMSPHFLYRTELISTGDQPERLNDYELASRLSFFLWSSIPDGPLLEHAAAGDLHRKDVLISQVGRMLDDRRVGGLATEFVGNWLDFRRFESHNSVDRSRFAEFDDELRSAMFEEPIRFFVNLVQRDRSVLDCLYADRTMVNSALAKHYGMSELKMEDDLQTQAERPMKAGQWRTVEQASRFGRGGMLPMAVFLTKNAPGLRTSPVKRGYWVVRRLLGEEIPPPPPGVPELPSDESKLGELTLRQTLAKHRDHASCSGCHDRFDGIGLAFEGFGPVGERREMDLGGRPVDTQAVFPDGSQGDGVAGLKDYLRKQRQEDFVDNLCRKLLSYGLGRTLQLSDEALVKKMRVDARANEYRFSKMVEAIVTSPQFLSKRGRLQHRDHEFDPPLSNE